LVFFITLFSKGATVNVYSASYVGCYADNSLRHALPVLQINSGSLTPSQCLAACQDDPYFGLQSGTECWCGVGSYAEYGGSGGCNQACGGDSSVTCGGSNANSVYAVGSFAVPTTQTTPSYVGCYADNSGSHALPTVVINGDPALSLAVCFAACQGYNFLGLQDGNQCWCGNSGYAEYGTSAACNMPCGGDANTCGGSNANSVYAVVPLSTNCSSATIGNAVFPNSDVNEYAIGACVSGYSGTPALYCNSSAVGAVWNPASTMVGCCAPVCNPVCLHGGVCLGPNSCQCRIYNGVLYSGPTCATASCPAVLQSNAYWPNTAVGATASGICASGYVGTVSRSCILAGFQTITGQCILNTTTCAATSASNINWPATYANSYGFGTCASGYIPNGESPCKFCSNAAVWASTYIGSCSIAYCQPFTDSQSAWPMTIANSTVVTGYCLPGTSGTITRTCSLSGVTPVWSASTGSCS